MAKHRNVRVLILAGGSGSRLFPLSNDVNPKQFIDIEGKSLFQRVLELHRELDIFVSTKGEFIDIVEDQANAIGVRIYTIEEPYAKNTFPAIVWALRDLIHNNKVSMDDILVVAPSDHYIKPKEKYIESLEHALEIAQAGYIVTFGIEPTRPDTGFGYIKTGNPLMSGYRVEHFKEKPTREKAEEFLKEGKYLWNSGIFVFRVSTFMNECRNLQPTAYELLTTKDEDLAKELFDKVAESPVDKAIVERSDNVACVPFKAQWSDVGTFKGLYEILCPSKGNIVLKGDLIDINANNVLVHSEDKPVIVVGIDNIAVINSNDYILIVSMESSQDVKKAYEAIKIRKCR